MKQDIRMIVSDLDGTLLNNEGRISDYTKHTLQSYQKQGYTLMLATGRFFHETKHIREQLQLNKFNGYIACCNGAQVYNAHNHSIHSFDMLAIEEAHHLMKVAQEHKLCVYIQHQRQYQLQVPSYIKPFTNLAKITANILKVTPINQMIPYLDDLLETNITSDCVSMVQSKLYKICFLGTPNRLANYRQEIHKRLPNTYNFFDVTGFTMEIVRHSVSKAHAVQYVCDQIGITMDQVIAFGDSGNDEPLLEKAGIGITMKNGYKPTLQKAKLISTCSNHEDGVARALKDFLK